MNHIAGRYRPTINNYKWIQNKTPHLCQITSQKYERTVLSTLLYYRGYVDSKIIRYANEISQVQYKPTQDTKKKSDMLLEYASIYPNSVIYYNLSDMLLHVDSYSAHILFPNVRSFTAGNFFLINCYPPKPSKPIP